MKKTFARTALLLLGFAGLIPANTITLSGVGTADFTFGSGGFTVTVSNLTPAFDATTLLSDLIFRLSTPGPVSFNGITQGQLVTVDKNGNVTNVAGTPNWGFGTFTMAGSPFNGEFLLCTVCGAGVQSPNPPKQTILGPGDNGGFTSYTGVNASIAGNPAHNPFLLGSATFSFSGSSITPGTTASGVAFSFGTAFGKEVFTAGGGGGGGGGQIPEPSTLILAGSALVGLALFTKRRMSSNAA